MQKYSRSTGYAGGLLVLAFGTYCVLADDSGADTPQSQAQPRVIRSIGDALQEGLLVAPHAAAGRRVVRTSGEAIEAPPQNSVGKSGSTRFRLGADSFTSGFEPPCALGYIGGGGSDDPQNCEWHASNSVPLLATSPVIDDSNEFAGIQHLHFQFDPFQPSGLALGARNWAFSEDIPNPPIGGVMTLKLQLYICLVPKDCVSDSGGLNGYRIRPQAPSEGKATALMWFLSTGEIVVFEDPDDDGTLDGFFPPFTWVPGEYKQVSIVVDNINNRVRYFYDEDLVWSTGAGEGGQGSGVFAGTKIEHVLIRYEDNQNDQTFMDIDDVVIEPGETTLPTGACCNFDGLGGCQRMAEDACAATTTGLYGGLNTDCSAELCTALTVCGQVDTGSCLDPLGTPSPGCEEIECCIQICKVDSLCCENIWDDGCAALAIAECTIPCAHGDTQCQDLGILDAFNSTNGEFQVADNFTPAADGSINSICWSGVYLENPFIEDIFSVRYYECVDGSPTNLIAEFSESDLSLTVTGKVDSGLDLAGFLDIFEYTALHADVPVTAGEVYFIEVSNAPPGGDAWFWEIADITDTDGDGIFFQKPHGEDYARFYKGCRADLSFCLNLELGVLTGLCDVPVPLACVEELQIPKLAILEGEVCGDANNEKCDTATPIVISHDPENPTFVHGQAFAEAGIADNDWYAFDVADLNADDEAVVCVSIVSELPMHTGLVQDLSNACVEDGLIEDLLQSVSLPCDPSLSVAYAVDAPGNFLLHARVADGCGIIEGYPCPNDYVLQLSVANTIEECAGCGLFTCPEDLDQNGEVRVSDLIILLGSWGLCPAEGLCCADFDEDGEVRVPDLITMLGEWGPCVVTLGACCNAGGPGLCETMTASECTNSGGVFLGPQTDCADCPPASCGLGNGDCCTPNGTPGCEEVSCCSAVCEVSSLCCTTDWSAACAAVAEFLCESCFPPPANDNCADATVIFDGDTTFDTSTATTDGPAHEECQFDGQTYNDVWFDYMSTCPGPLTVSTCGQANYDTDVAVYKGCDCPVTDSDLLGCNDDAEECAVFTSQVTVPIQNNQCYKIRIGGFASGNSGTGTVTVTCGG